MSRIGRKPIPVPQEVELRVEDGQVSVKGPKGALTWVAHPDMTIQIEDGVITVARPSDQRMHRALHGLTRTLIANMVIGVTQGFEKSLEMVGVGYRVQKSEDGITLQVGFSHTVEVKPLPATTIQVEGNNRIIVQGPDKQQVGELAARIRKVRPPNAYTGKGIRYAGEYVRVKPGKSAGRK